jgi:hypothetical protein
MFVVTVETVAFPDDYYKDVVCYFKTEAQADIFIELASKLGEQIGSKELTKILDLDKELFGDKDLSFSWEEAEEGLHLIDELTSCQERQTGSS